MLRTIRNVPSLLVATALVAACSKGGTSKVTCPAGQHESAGQCVVDVLPDSTAPSTTLSVEPGTYRSLAEFTLTADEPATVYYTTDGSAPEAGGATTMSGASPLTVPAPTASFTLKYFAVDTAGNKESVKEAAFVIDGTVAEAVTGLTAVGAKGAASVEVKWTKPASADVTGVMIVRTPHDPFAGDPPEAGKTYAVNDTLGSGTVVYVGEGSSFTDTAVTGWQKYEYRAFSFDALKNYAEPAIASAQPEYFVATIHVPKDGGELTITPAPGAGGLLLAGSALLDHGDLLLTLTATGDADRTLNNPKLVLKGEIANSVELGETHGVFQGKPYFYFGPSGLKKGETSDSQSGTVKYSVDDVDFDVELVPSPIVMMSSGDGSEGFYDSATMHEEYLFDSLLEGTTDRPKLWHNAVSPDGRKLYIATVNRNRLVAVDLETMLVENLKLNPEKELTDTTVSPGGFAISPDGQLLYMSASFKEQDPNDLKTYWNHALVLYSIVDGLKELGRTTLGRIEASGGGGSDGIEGSLAIDFTTGIAWVPEAGTGNLWPVDIDPLHAIDTDGETMNGVTPITFVDPDPNKAPSESRYLNPVSVAVSPDGKTVYVGFGYSNLEGNNAKELAVVPTDMFGPVTFLSSTAPCDVSGTALMFGPNDKLYAPRAGYVSMPEAGPTPESAPGISVFTLGETPAEVSVNVLGSAATHNSAIRDIEFVPGTTLAWASLADAGTIFVFDWTTGQPVDADGDGTNGHTNIPAAQAGTTGGELVSTPF